jgi:hypothetical protein
MESSPVGELELAASIAYAKLSQLGNHPRRCSAGSPSRLLRDEQRVAQIVGKRSARRPDGLIILGSGMKLFMDAFQARAIDRGVDLRGLNAGVAEQLLDLPKIGSPGEHVGSEAVA